MESKKNTPSFHAKTRADWRKWLEKNYATEKVVWLIIYHKTAKTPSVYYAEAVEEALCFGWIDSLANKHDENSIYLSFYPRKPKSNWSKLNRERVERLAKDGLMMPAGQAMIDLAKETGTWDAMVDIENGIIPPDLQILFDRNKTAFDNFNAFAPSSRKLILKWIQDAKRPENIKANHPK